MRVSRSGSGYHHGNLRPVLLAAALEMLETQSPSALSLREVARRAGVSHNAPYHHFGDRTGLLSAVGAEAMARFLAAQRSAVDQVDGSGAPGDPLVAMATAYVEWAVAHPGAFEVVFDPSICPPGDPSTAMAPLIRANEDLLRDVTARCWPGLPPDELDRLQPALWGTVHGLAALVAAGHLPSEAVRPALQVLVER